MESLVYDNSPLADYLEGEGENDGSWPVEEPDNADIPNLATEFAPRGPSRFQAQVRNKLPEPHDTKSSRSLRVLSRLYDSCTSALDARIGKRDNERFLDRFGYIIVASQLLNEHSAPSYASARNVVSNARAASIPSISATFGVQEAIVTASASFLAAWPLHWSRSRTGPGFSSRKLVVLLTLVPVLGILFYVFCRRQWLKYVRHQAVDDAATFVSNAQGFDSAASASVVFIQEVELVSRGYRISTPLPPVSRLEDQTQIRRCLRLRRVVSECLLSLLEQYIQAQYILRPLTDAADLEKYYDIYDISREDLAEAESGISDRIAEDQYSLFALRALFGRLYSIRKSILCCLLALGADGGASDIRRWSTAIEEMRSLSAATGTCTGKMTGILNEEDGDVISPQLLPVDSHDKDHIRAQQRRLTALAQGIRALHAKMHIIREESDASLESTDIEEFEANLMAQYESLGTDIKNLLEEWESGRIALLNDLDKRSMSEQQQLSRPSSGLKWPPSPSPSLGGSTAVEGGPSDALKALIGETRQDNRESHIIGDEEIFEALALPTRSKRSSLTREERIARVKEDRAKQAAARERADANTTMLKELEMVIKQRPRSATKTKRVTSI